MLAMDIAFERQVGIGASNNAPVSSDNLLASVRRAPVHLICRRVFRTMDPNSYHALLLRRDAGTLTWRGPLLMLFARAACAVGAQALVAAVFTLRSSPTPWHDAGQWLPVYGTLIDAGCLALLWRFTRPEGIRLVDLVGFVRKRFVRDALLGLALIPVGLVFIYGGTSAAGWLLYGALSPPYFFAPLPLPATLYGVLVWPLIWGLTEQMTYNGYLVPRFQVLCRNTSLAIAVVAFAWSAQHAFMPLTFDAKFMAFRLVSAVPFSIFSTFLYLRLRRLLPFVIAHALMDSATVLIGALRN
jgi:membrane protease YdiL (CAAX protease family)